MTRLLKKAVALLSFFPLAVAAATSLQAASLESVLLDTYAVLAGTTVTNTPLSATLITGNVGVSPNSAITGFINPSCVTSGAGSVSPSPPYFCHSNDADAIQAQIDWVTSYNVMQGMSETADLTGQDLGGMTLTAGVYSFSSTAELTGTLTLDGQGNPNATFIFQIGSSLTTASDSSIVLINGAQGGNVYFVVAADATLGTDTTFVGDILALNAITLNTGATIICGAALAHNAAVTLDDNQITVCQLIAATFGDILDGVDSTPNADAVADALDDYEGDLPDALQDLLDFLSAEDLADALDQLSGEVGAGVAPTAMQAMNSFLSLMLNSWTHDGPRSAPNVVTVKALGYAEERAPQQFSSFDPPAVEPQHWDMWGAVFGSVTNTQGQSGAHDRWGHAYGIASGFDYRVSPDTRVGLSVAGGGTNFGLSDDRGEGHSDMLQSGIYARTNVGQVYLAAALAYAWHDVTTNRTVTMPSPISVTENLAATFSAHNAAGHVEAGLRLGWFIPYGALRQQIFYTPAYTEKAVGNSTDDYALDYLENTATVTRTEIGARVEKKILSDGADSILTLRGRIAWAHDFWSNSEIMARFHSTPDMDPWVVEGAAAPTDSILVSAGVEIGFAQGFAIAGWFDGEFAENSQIYAGTARVSYAW